MPTMSYINLPTVWRYITSSAGSWSQGNSSFDVEFSVGVATVLKLCMPNRLSTVSEYLFSDTWSVQLALFRWILSPINTPRSSISNFFLNFLFICGIASELLAAIIMSFTRKEMIIMLDKVRRLYIEVSFVLFLKPISSMKNFSIFKYH